MISSAGFFLDLLASAFNVFAHTFHGIAACSKSDKCKHKGNPQGLFHLIAPIFKIKRGGGRIAMPTHVVHAAAYG